MKIDLKSQVKHAKLWFDDSVEKYRYPETNLVFCLVDGLIYIYDIDDTDQVTDLLRSYFLSAVLEAYQIPLEEFQEYFKDCEIDSWSSMHVYDVNTLEEV